MIFGEKYLFLPKVIMFSLLFLAVFAACWILSEVFVVRLTNHISRLRFIGQYISYQLPLKKTEVNIIINLLI